jgi:hypothetical protein
MQMELHQPVVIDYGTFTYGRANLPAELPKNPTLAQIKALQDVVAQAPQIDCPVEHLFAPGMYARKCTIPAGSVVVGKMHRHQHPTFLLSGTVQINTDQGMEEITGPHIWISQENAKRALHTLTDCVFATVHLNPTDTTDLEAIEADVIVPEALIPYDAPTELASLANDIQGVYA